MRLVDAFLKLAGWVGVGDDACSRLQVRTLALHEHGADTDAGIEIAGEVGVEHRSAVNATAHRFQFFDDLHGANFRGAAQRACGKTCGKGVERAEHVMLVDLGRNDLGRVSKYGSVKVRNLMYVERYSHVMHLVSALEGRLRPELSAMDAFAACFPAGTLSGAPKVRAMQIIEELEPTRRGVYGGAVLYADFAGNLDSCIAIRTMVMKGKKATLQAGAGIVADSDPQREFEETENKARAVLRAVEMARGIE